MAIWSRQVYWREVKLSRSRIFSLTPRRYSSQVRANIAIQQKGDPDSSVIRLLANRSNSESMSPSTEMKTSPVPPTTPETQTEEPMLDIQTLMKLSDEEKCFQYEKMKTPVCSSGFPTYTSPAITIFPVHECRLLFSSLL